MLQVKTENDNTSATTITQPTMITTGQPKESLATLLKEYARVKPNEILYTSVDVNGKEAKRYTTVEFLARAEGVARGLIKHGVCIVIVVIMLKLSSFFFFVDCWYIVVLTLFCSIWLLIVCTRLL